MPQILRRSARSISIDLIYTWVLCDLLLRSWSLMLHHPWRAYEEIFDQTGDETFWSIWVSFGGSSFNKSDWWVCVLAAQQCLEDHMFFLGLQMSPHLSEAPHQRTRDLSWAVMSCFCRRNREKRFCFLAHALRVCVKSFQELPRFRSWIWSPPRKPNKSWNTPVMSKVSSWWWRVFGWFATHSLALPVCLGRFMYRIRDPGLNAP